MSSTRRVTSWRLLALARLVPSHAEDEMEPLPLAGIGPAQGLESRNRRHRSQGEAAQAVEAHHPLVLAAPHEPPLHQAHLPRGAVEVEAKGHPGQSGKEEGEDDEPRNRRRCPRPRRSPHRGPRPGGGPGQARGDPEHGQHDHGQAPESGGGDPRLGIPLQGEAVAGGVADDLHRSAAFGGPAQGEAEVVARVLERDGAEHLPSSFRSSGHRPLSTWAPTNEQRIRRK